MSHRGFLADILEHPDDDTPRLIYADWLDEHGEPDRAEFIRLQVEMTRFPEGDPRACDLDTRADDILVEFENAWLGEWSERLVRWTFRRGFLDEITITPDVFLRHGEELFQSFPVRKARFVDANGEDLSSPAIEAVVSTGAFTFVRELDASGSSVSDWASELARNPWARGLRKLSLADNSAEGRDSLDRGIVAALCSAPQLMGLSELDLSSVDGDDPELGRDIIDLLAGASFAPQLRSLVLDGQGITDEGLERLATDPVFSGLERLRLADQATIETDTVPVLAASSRLERLRELCLGWECPLRDLASAPRLRQLKRLDYWPSNRTAYSTSSWAAFASALAPGQLSHLGLGHSILPGDAVEVLLNSPGLNGLRGLAVWGGEGDWVRDQILTTLCKHPPRLTSLDLTRTGRSATGLRALGSSPCLGALSHLRLWWDDTWNPTQNEFLASREFSPRLKSLDLAGWRLGDEGCAALAGNPGLTGLRDLKLRSSGVTFNGMTGLAASAIGKRLTSLHLGGGPTEAALRSLSEHGNFPRLRELVIEAPLRGEWGSILRTRFGGRLRVILPT